MSLFLWLFGYFFLPLIRVWAMRGGWTVVGSLLGSLIRNPHGDLGTSSKLGTKFASCWAQCLLGSGHAPTDYVPVLGCRYVPRSE
ncbi:hypothetical protein B9Z19DRAFT_1083635 [Tuber borchii]|uniref:Secreted protein n=1 Tax=Tuber borchii TaxID=42251 RepID=A0A2T6ZT66_TUBBO|nr:hypothetical protein B9Z19DRAFT_1083635 [Tuber borchii]